MKTEKSLKKEVTRIPNLPSYYTSVTTKIDKGLAVLNKVVSLEPEVFCDPLVSLSLDNITQDLTNLITLVKNKTVQNLHDLGTFLGDAFLKYMSGGINDNEATVVLSLAHRYLESYTPGVVKALSKVSYKGKCRSCGFKLPNYPGAYPKHCPECGARLTLASLKTENAEKVCFECRTLYNGKHETCTSCKKDLLRLSTETEDSGVAIFEVFYLVQHVLGTTQTFLEFCGDNRLPLRRETILDQVGDKAELLYKLIEGLLRKRSLKSLEEDSSSIISLVTGLDGKSLAALYPLMMGLSEGVFEGVSESIYKELSPLVSEVRQSARDIILDSTISEGKYPEGFIEFLGDSYSNLISYYIDKPSIDYTQVVESLIPEHIQGIRQEVKNRRGLFDAVSNLGVVRFNIDEALKGYSSCLTRVVIEHEKSKSLPLGVLRDLVFQNMGKLFQGKYEESVNFLRSVFLS